MHSYPSQSNLKLKFGTTQFGKGSHFQHEQGSWRFAL